MSDDLISRKALLEILNMRLTDYSHDTNSGAKRIADTYMYQIIPLVEKQDIAYDKEKVIKELKELKMMYFLTIANTGDEKMDFAYEKIGNAIDKAIEIVEKGANR